MTAKEWLEQIQEADNEVERRLHEQRRALEKACGGSICLTDDKIQTSHDNGTERKFIEYAYYSRLIDEAIDKYVDLKRKVEQTINKIDNEVYRTLLIDKYVYKKSWRYISDKLELNYSTVRGKKHNKSLRELEKILQDIV